MQKFAHSHINSAVEAWNAFANNNVSIRMLKWKQTKLILHREHAYTFIKWVLLRRKKGDSDFGNAAYNVLKVLTITSNNRFIFIYKDFEKK